MTKTATQRFYGWHAPSQDKLDRAFKFEPQIATANLPPRVDLRGICIPKAVYDQGQLGSCTANATAALAQTLMIKQGKPSFMPSRDFIYYNERVMEGTVGSDSGAQLADGMAVLANYGVPHESLWPYTGNRWLWKPTIGVYADALRHRVAQEMNLIQDAAHFKACLASGFPFVGGFTVYESFESQEVANTGVVSMPKSGEQTVGGHAILVVGYDDPSGVWIVRNSWGLWGQGGYFTIPQEYFTDPNLASDFWTANSIAI